MGSFLRFKGGGGLNLLAFSAPPVYPDQTFNRRKHEQCHTIPTLKSYKFSSMDISYFIRQIFEPKTKPNKNDNSTNRPIKRVANYIRKEDFPRLSDGMTPQDKEDLDYSNSSIFYCREPIIEIHRSRTHYSTKKLKQTNRKRK